MIMTEEEFRRVFGKEAPKQKYRNQKCEFMGIRFDSRREMTRYVDLYYQQKAGEIENLQRQVKYELLPKQKDENGKVIEKPVYYIADFVYKRDGKVVVEDAKGFRTKEFIIKRKMALWFLGIRIVEV